MCVCSNAVQLTAIRSKVDSWCSFCNRVPFAGLCPDWETWDPVKPVQNATEAMQLADDWLGIPQVRPPAMHL